MCHASPKSSVSFGDVQLSEAWQVSLAQIVQRCQKYHCTSHNEGELAGLAGLAFVVSGARGAGFQSRTGHEVLHDGLLGSQHPNEARVRVATWVRWVQNLIDV